jgi:hypothetical protein
MPKTLKNKKGGIFIDSLPRKNPKETFYDFLENSSISYLSNGANGLIFKVAVNPTYTSSYKYTNEEAYNQPVTEIILKLTLMNDNNEIGNFKNEINVQTQVFKGSMDYLQPLCPAIVYADILDNRKSKNEFINILIKNNHRWRESKIPYLDNGYSLNSDIIYSNDIKLGIIGMEIATGYTTLWQIVRDNSVNDDDKIRYINYSLYVILKLALDFEYTHGDFHGGNIMIHPDIEYFNGLKGRAMLIDFGYSNKIPEKQMEEIKRLVGSEKYIEALQRLCYIERSDTGFPEIYEWRKFYGWICNDWNSLLSDVENETNGEKKMENYKILLEYEKIKERRKLNETQNQHYIYLVEQFKPSGKILHSSNDTLKNLFKKREDKEKKIIDEFELLNKTDPADFPLLPLSEKEKERVYQGIEEHDTLLKKFKNLLLLDKGGGRKMKKNKKTQKNKTTRKMRKTCKSRQ